MLQGHAGLNGDAIPHTVNAEDGVWAEVCVVTPAIARDWIQVNTKNRRIRPAKVDQYAASMKAGRWAFNGQAIVFDVHGRLMNGQHRLLACIKAGVSFKVLVVHGVDAEAFDTLDTGAARTAGDILGIAGIARPSVAAGVVKLLVNYERGISVSLLRQTSMMPDAAVDRATGDALFLEACGMAEKLKNILVPAVGGFTFYVLARKSHVEAKEFFDQLLLGTGLKLNDPVWKLREYLLNSRQDKRDQYRVADQIIVTIKAWNARRTGTPLGKMMKGYRSDMASKAVPEIK